MGVNLLRAGSPTGVRVRCLRACPYCGAKLGVVELKKYGYKWFAGDEHLLLAHRVWDENLAGLVMAAHRRVMLAAGTRPPAYGDAETNGWASVAPPPGPFNTVEAAKNIVVWTFAKRAQYQADQPVGKKLSDAAKVLHGSSYTQPWDWFAAGIVEAIRMQSQPATADVIHGMDSLAAQSGYRGWFAVPATVSPLPSQRYYGLKIAMFLTVYGQNGTNPDVQRDSSLLQPLLSVANKIVNAPAFATDTTDNHLGVVALCDWVLSQLPATATDSRKFVESIRAVASGTRPRTVEQVAKQQWDITVDAAKDAAGSVAKAGTEVVESAKKGVDDAAGQGTSTAMMVGGGVVLISLLGIGVYAWGKK